MSLRSSPVSCCRLWVDVVVAEVLPQVACGLGLLRHGDVEEGADALPVPGVEPVALLVGPADVVGPEVLAAQREVFPLLVHGRAEGGDQSVGLLHHGRVAAGLFEYVFHEEEVYAIPHDAQMDGIEVFHIRRGFIFLTFCCRIRSRLGRNLSFCRLR